MTPRVGIDLVAIDAVREALARHGSRYLDRTFTAAEQAACLRPGGPDARRLAACFAAKEATVKVLRPRAGEPLPWTDVEVRPGEDGRWTVAVHGRAAQLAAAAGLEGFTVSVTTESGHAAAVVLAGPAA